MVVKKLSKKEAADTAATKAVFDRITDGYDPGPEPIGLRFGLQFPKTSERAWGFRAIKEGTGFSLLHDRQDDWPHIGCDLRPTEEQTAFLKFIDANVLAHLRRYAGWLYADDARYYHFKFTYDGKPVWAVISPQASYGYIYGVVYVGPQ
jgi:hypothetical protein